ncbi:hypothetical protein, partial [Mesonia mobilis]|uniref:hypothetical protein n=1 Tax=Mesonia mobilis TaxID=369791 RepID=UPI0026EFE244
NTYCYFNFNMNFNSWHTFHERRKSSKNLRAGSGGLHPTSASERNALRSVCHPQAEVIATNFQA